MPGNRPSNSNPLDMDIKGANRAVRRLIAILVLTWVVLGSALYLWWIPVLIPPQSCLGGLPVPCAEVQHLTRAVVSSSIAVAIISALGYSLIQRFNTMKEDRLKREIESQVVLELEQALVNQAEMQKRFSQYGIADCCMSLDLIKEKALKLH